MKKRLDTDVERALHNHTSYTITIYTSYGSVTLKIAVQAPSHRPAKHEVAKLYSSTHALQDRGLEDNSQMRWQLCRFSKISKQGGLGRVVGKRMRARLEVVDRIDAGRSPV
jgi:hypothetical protein